MSRLLAAILVSAAIFTPLSAQAFGLGDVPGMGAKSDNAGSTDLSGAQDQLVKQYVSAAQSVLEGDAKMADALGLTTNAASNRAASATLTEGATKGALSDANKTASENSNATAEALKHTENMDAPAKAKFAAGISSLAQGLVKYVGMKSSFDSFASGLSSASPMMLPKLQSGAYIVSSLPSNLKTLSSSLKNALAYANAHDIKVPKTEADVLSKL